MLIPIVGNGNGDGDAYPITAEQILEFRQAYPGVNVIGALKQMRAWSIANPKLRKTKRGMLRFVNSWLARAQDRAPRQPERNNQGQDHWNDSLLDESRRRSEERERQDIEDAAKRKARKNAGTDAADQIPAQ